MNSESLIAIIRIVVPAICSVLGVCGIAVDADAWTSAVLVLAGGVASIYTGWKNNNVSKAAQQAQRYLKATKEGLHAKQ